MILDNSDVVSNWIQQVVVPSLSVDDGALLLNVRSWVCQVADTLDENQDLPGAILMLKVSQTE